MNNYKHALAVNISTAVGTAPALISETLVVPSFSVKQASCAGVIEEGEGSVTGLIPTVSRAFFCLSESPELVLLVVVEFVFDWICVFDGEPNNRGLSLKGSMTKR